MATIPQMNRRQFLRRAAQTVAGAAAFPLLIPASAVGADGHTAPSERITMGFIGVGAQGGGHLFGGAWTYVAGGYAGRENVQVLAVCDIRQERRETARQKVNEVYAARFGTQKYTSCEAYNDFRDVLARQDIDAVLIASPVHWHGIMAILAAQAGKDVYCEKPTAITIRESQAMVKAMRRYGRVFQAGTQQRSEYGGKFRLACEIVRSGRIGQLKEVYAFRPGGTFEWKTSGKELPMPENIDWDLYLGPAPWMPYDGNVGAHRFCGVGDLNWGPHHYDIVQWVLNADRSGPVQVWIEDNVLQYRYENGVVVHACPHPDGGPGGSGGARFIGTEGWVAVDRDNITAHPRSLLERSIGTPVEGIYRSESHSGNFLECIRTRRRTICDIETAHRSTTTVHLGGLALQLKRSLKWDPKQELFENDDEANRLLSTTFRAPWTI